MVERVRAEQFAAARSAAAAALPASDAAAAGAVHDPAAHGAGPGAAEERAARRKCSVCLLAGSCASLHTKAKSVTTHTHTCQKYLLCSVPGAPEGQ